MINTYVQRYKRKYVKKITAYFNLFFTLRVQALSHRLTDEVWKFYFKLKINTKKYKKR